MKPKFDSKLDPSQLLARFLSQERIDRIEHVLEQRTNSLTVVLDRVQNFHNISAVLRSADAFGLSCVHLIGEQFEYSSGITLGAERWLSLKTYSNTEDLIHYLNSEEYALVILEPNEVRQSTEDKPKGIITNSIPIFELPFEKRLALVFGNERSGVSQEIKRSAIYRAHIPMFGFVESFNISVACAISLFCSTISEAKGIRKTETLAEEDRAKMRSDWYEKSVRRGDEVLKEITNRENK